jgi:hypothetical protein
MHYACFIQRIEKKVRIIHKRMSKNKRMSEKREERDKKYKRRFFKIGKKDREVHIE